MDTNTIETEITKIEPKKGDILIVRIKGQANRQRMSKYMSAVKELLNKNNKYKDVGVIGVVGDVEIQNINEKMMNQFGWFKRRKNKK